MNGQFCLKSGKIFNFLYEVLAGFVEHAEDGMYSSQRNYSNKYALIEIDKIEF